MKSNRWITLTVLVLLVLVGAMQLRNTVVAGTAAPVPPTPWMVAGTAAPVPPTPWMVAGTAAPVPPTPWN